MKIQKYVKPPPSHGYFSVFSNSYQHHDSIPTLKSLKSDGQWQYGNFAHLLPLYHLLARKLRWAMENSPSLSSNAWFFQSCWFLSGYHWDVLGEGSPVPMPQTPTSPHLHCNSQARKVQSPAVAPGDQLKFNRPEPQKTQDLDVSENRDTPKSSILIGFSIINHPFWGPVTFGNTHLAIWQFTLLKFHSSTVRPLKSYQNPKAKDRLPSIILEELC